jgi:hypothetical protein
MNSDNVKIPLSTANVPRIKRITKSRKGVKK